MPKKTEALQRVYLEGQGDFVSGIILGTTWVIGVIKPLTKSP